MPTDTFRHNAAEVVTGCAKNSGADRRRGGVWQRKGTGATRVLGKRRMDLSPPLRHPRRTESERRAGEEGARDNAAGGQAVNIRGHNMKTLSEVSRKAHSNVLSLAREAALQRPPLSRLVQCHVRTSGFLARVHSRPRRIRVVEKALLPRAGGGRTGADAPEGAGTRNFRRARRAPRDPLNPVDETDTRAFFSSFFFLRDDCSLNSATDSREMRG